VPRYLPKSRVYFFSYPTLFKEFSSKPEICKRSIVLYTHNEQPELASDQSQVDLLNKAHSIHFFSSKDAHRLCNLGLSTSKVRIVNGAVDLDVIKPNLEWTKRENLIVMASRFGYRKSPERIPAIVELLPKWKFVLLGRGWEKFLIESKLNLKANFEYYEFNKENRNKFFPSSKIFLSTSLLEGGPIPLLEAMYCGVYPVVSNTGFAQDVLGEDSNRHIFEFDSNPRQVQSMIEKAFDKSFELHSLAKNYSWDNLARHVYEDYLQIRDKQS
jgi:glycosyltransferase involved in cell wall biosynthesis